MKIMYTKEELPELIGQIIDVFDDFLEERAVRIPSSDGEMRESGPGWKNNTARIYGTDYGDLAEKVERILAVKDPAGEKAEEDCIAHYRTRLREYFSDITVQGQLQKKGRFEEAEWMLENCMGYSREEIRKIYDEEYRKSVQM